MIELLHRPGFLGTQANFAADMTLVLMLLIAALLTFGVVMARKRRYQVHRWVQTSAATLIAILALWLMVLPYRDFVIRDMGGPRQSAFYLVTSAHALVGLLGFTFGSFVTLRANKLVPKALRFNNYKLFMRVAYGLYMITILLGVWVYFTWFVNNPNPPVY